MADDENRAFEGFQLFREPLELFLPDVRRITTLVIFGNVLTADTKAVLLRESLVNGNSNQKMDLTEIEVSCACHSTGR